MSSIRILIADDYEDWRDRIRLLLQARPECQVICEVSDGSEAVQRAGELKPDLIFLEVGLAGLNGIETARRIRQLSPDSRILFLSLDNSVDVVQVALSTGARGYVYKPRAESDLLPAIDTVLRGDQFVSSMLRGYKFIGAPGAQGRHRHDVQFYFDDAVFLDSFTRFISAALEAGDVAIVAATQPHRDSLFGRLKAKGLDIDTAIQNGTYIPLDVAEALSTFMVNDMPDSKRFFEVSGDLIRAAAKAGKGEHPRIAACGECSPFLWAQGKTDAAIRVEQLWDELATIYELDILCAYSLNLFRGEEDQPSFQSVCAQHTAVYSQAE